MFKKIKDFFGFGGGETSPTPPVLRNKPGGLARMVRMHEARAAELEGCIVTTVRINEHGLWAIDPTLLYTPTQTFKDAGGLLVQAGLTHRMIGLHDSNLIPLNNPGEHEKDETLEWLPVPAGPAPTVKPETEKEN